MMQMTLLLLLLGWCWIKYWF